MKAIMIEASKSRCKYESEGGLRMARRLHSVRRRTEPNRIRAAADEGSPSPS